MKLEVGKRVTAYIEDRYIDDAKLQKQGDHWYLCQDEEAGSSCRDKLGYSNSWQFREEAGGGYSADVRDIRAKGSTNIEDIHVGASVVHGSNAVMVLGICGNVVHLSKSYDRLAFDKTVTLEQLKTWGYKLVPEEDDTEEVTMADVCKKFGYDVKIKKD